MNELRLEILKTVKKFDGQYGWYQLDRAISSSGIVINENLLGVLRELEAHGFISSLNDEKGKDPKYLLTPTGRHRLEQQHDELPP